MHIGITGTRWGMSERQKEIAIYVYEKWKGSHLHQGMCKGSDTEMHDMVREKFPLDCIHGHPPLEETYAVWRECDYTYPAKDYLDRNKDIVDQSEIMIATPYESEEQKRSGTWSTIRYAKKVIKSGKGMCKKLCVIKPDGKVDYFDYDKLQD